MTSCLSYDRYVNADFSNKVKVLFAHILMFIKHIEILWT